MISKYGNLTINWKPFRPLYCLLGNWKTYLTTYLTYLTTPLLNTYVFQVRSWLDLVIWAHALWIIMLRSFSGEFLASSQTCFVRTFLRGKCSLDCSFKRNPNCSAQFHTVHAIQTNGQGFILTNQAYPYLQPVKPLYICLQTLLLPVAP